jgi:peptidoglycan/xylan/chitin deacetylase (PgdA/CDA1 family)
MNYSDRLSDKGYAIFLLHGVVEKSDYRIRNYTRKHLEKDYFHHVMLDLKRSGHPLSMDDVIRHHSEGIPFPSHAFAITFDDGFQNTYSIAAPILSELRIPATFYNTTQFVGGNGMSWIDRIEYCMEAVAEVRLTLPWYSGTYTLRNRQDKIRFLDYLRSRVKNDENINADKLASNVCAQCGIEEKMSSNDPLDLKMNWEHVRELSCNELFSIGGHSHHHVNLNFLSHDELESEVVTSIRLLKEKAQVSPRHYSYPEGLENCYSDKVIGVLKENGVVCSPTAIDGINEPGTDLFHLRRIAIV